MADIETIKGTSAKVAVRLCNFLSGRSDLLKAHELWLDAYIKPAITSFQAPYVNIIGYASRLGNAKKNRELSQRRCENVKARIAGYSSRVMFPLELGKGEAESGPDERDNNGYWRAVDVFVYGAKVAEPPPVKATDNLENRLLIVQQIVDAHKIKRRAEWGKLTPDYKSMDKDWDYDSIVIHHLGNSINVDPKAVETLHMSTNGHSDVDYHYFVHPNGTIYEGRKLIYKGAHVRNANTRKIGILMMGDFDEQWYDFDDDLSAKHLQTLGSLITTLKKQFGNMKYLGGHIEFAAAQGQERTCPGNLLMGRMNGLRSDFGLNAPTKP